MRSPTVILSEAVAMDVKLFSDIAILHGVITIVRCLRIKNEENITVFINTTGIYAKNNFSKKSHFEIGAGHQYSDDKDIGSSRLNLREQLPTKK